MFQKIKDNIEGYIETKVELVKLDVEEKLSMLILKLAKLMIFLTAFGLFFFFLSIAIAQMLNTWLESRFLGYLILASFYLSIVLVFYLFKDKDEYIFQYFSSKIKFKKDEGKS